MPTNGVYQEVLPSLDDELAISLALAATLIVSLRDRVYWIEDPEGVRAALKGPGITKLLVGAATLCKPSARQLRRLRTRRRIFLRRQWRHDERFRYRPLVERVMMALPPPPARECREWKDVDGVRSIVIEPGCTATITYPPKWLVRRVEIATPIADYVAIESILTRKVIEHLEGPASLAIFHRDGAGHYVLEDQAFHGHWHDLVIRFKNRSPDQKVHLALRAWGIDLEVEAFGAAHGA